MTTQSDLARAAQRLLTAEQTYLRMKTYCDNLPADTEYDLGLRVDWQWGSSTDGYKEMNFAVQQAVKKQLRDFMVDSLEAARQELFAAQRALKAAA